MTATTRGAHCAGVGCGHEHRSAGTATGSEHAERFTPQPRSAGRGRRAARRRDRISADLATLGSGRRVATPVTVI